MNVSGLLQIFNISKSRNQTASLVALALVLAVLLLTLSEGHASASMLELRKTYTDARNALDRKDMRRWRKLKPGLSDYPLYPYLVFMELHAQGNRTSDAQIASAMESATIPIPPYFKVWALSRFYRSKDWENIAHFFPNSKDPKVRCKYAESLIHTAGTSQAQPILESLWLVSKSQPPECDRLFNYGLQNNLIGDQLIWERLLLTSARNRTSMNRYLTSLFESENSVQRAELLRRAHRNPETMLTNNASKWHSTDWGKDLIDYSLKRLTRKDPDGAIEMWHRLIQKGIIRAEDYASTKRYIAMSLAKKHHPEAHSWLSGLPNSVQDEDSQWWTFRSAALKSDWHGVLAALDTLHSSEGNISAVDFWRAQALLQTGEDSEAHSILNELAAQPNYYGFLAADFLGVDYPLHVNPTADGGSFNKIVTNNESIVRIRELLLLNRKFTARRELHRLKQDIDDQDFWYSAALLFGRWGWHDGAINAFRKTEASATSVINVLYPQPYLDIVARESARHYAPRQWIYGIMRQESLFIPNIASSAGATGLMQLMLNTAKFEANRQRLKRPSRSSLRNPALNIRLGSGYFKRLYVQSDDNIVISLASYNAGAVNVKKWLRSTDITDTLIWIETIPFRETRLYVKKVLENITIYSFLIELEGEKLSSYLKPVNGDR